MVASFNFSTAPVGQIIPFGSSSATFTGCDLGTISSDRLVVVGMGHDGASFGIIVDKITIGGQVAQQLVYTSCGPAGFGCGLWSVADSVNATADIQVSFTTFGNRVDIAVGQLYGAVNAANRTAVFPSTFGPDPQTFSTGVPVYQYGIGVAMLYVGSTRGPPNWAPPTNSAGFTVTSSGAAGSFTTIALSYSNTPTTWQPSVSGNTIVSTDSGSIGYSFNAATMSLATWQQSGLVTQVPMGGICL